ncbi:MAG: putative Ig domain-containing protein [Methanomassiliicoccaceae archaeon]|nr:putative Ig domain-containing protein [Methanomassiliicoccaceae archaeon]
MNGRKRKSRSKGIVFLVSFALLFSAFAGVIGASVNDRDDRDGSLGVSSVSGMNVVIEWKDNFGGDGDDVFYGVAATSDGGFVAVGYSMKESFGLNLHNPSGGNSDALIIKYDKDGKIEWKKNFGGYGDDVFRAVTVMPNGNIVAAGSSSEETFGTGDWTGFTGRGGWDATVVVFSEEGNVVWKKNTGGVGDDHYYGVAITYDGNIVAVGSSAAESFQTGDWVNYAGRGGQDAIIVEYEATGQQKRGTYFGGSGIDVFKDVTVLPNGNIVAVGISYSASIGNGNWYGFEAKGHENAVVVVFGKSIYDTIVYKNNFGGIYYNFFYGVAATPDGGFAAVGNSSYYSFNSKDWNGVYAKGGNHDAIIVKYIFDEDSGGFTVEWAYNFGGTRDDSFFGVTVMPDGSIIAVGHNGYDAVAVKYVAGNEGAEVEWALPINESWYERYSFYGVAATENGFAAVGYRESAWIITFDGDGEKKWECHNDGYRGEFSAVAATPDGGFVAVGYSDRFGRGNAGWGGSDALIVKYDKNGKIEWFRNFGGESDDFFRGVAVLPNGNIVAVGTSYEDSFGTGDWTGPQLGDSNMEYGIAVVYDNNGNIVWKDHFGGGGDDYFYGVAATPAGGFAVVGFSYDVSLWIDDGLTDRGSDGIILKFSYAGGKYEMDWVRAFGGESYDYFYGVAVLANGNIVAVGTSYEDSFGTGNWTGIYLGDSNMEYGIAVVYDNNGNIVWKDHFGGGGDDYFYGVAATPDGGFAVVGFSRDVSLWIDDGLTDRESDGIIVKFSYAGGKYEKDWVRAFGGESYDYFYGVAVLPNGNIVAVGYVCVDSFGTGDLTGLTSKGGYYDAIVVVYDSDGNIRQIYNFGGNGIDEFFGVAALSGGGFVAIGSSGGSIGTGDWKGFAANNSMGDPIAVGFVQMCTITFNLNGGAGTAVNYVDVRAGSVLTAPAGTWTKAGYNNDGKWYVDSEGTKEFVFGVTQVNDNITLYLKWIAAAVVMNTVTVANGEFGKPYSYSVSASLEGGAAGAISYHLYGEGVLPPGLALNGSTGVISGTPKDIGEYRFTVLAVSTITNKENKREFTINIAGGYYYWSSHPYDLNKRFASLAQVSASGEYGFLIAVGSFADNLGGALFYLNADLSFRPGATVTWTNGTVNIGDIVTNDGTLIINNVTLNAKHITEIEFMGSGETGKGSIEMTNSKMSAQSIEVNNLKISGNSSIDSDTVTVGTLTSTDADSKLTIEGSLEADSIDFAGSMAIEGDLDVNGDVNAGDISVLGVLSISGDLDAGHVTAGEGTIGGAAYVKSISGSIEAAGGVTIKTDGDDGDNMLIFIVAAAAISALVVGGIVWMKKR